MKKDELIQFCYFVRKKRYENRQMENRSEALMLDRELDTIVANVQKEVGLDEYNSVMRSIERRKENKKRVNARIRHLNESFEVLYFVTITFTDEALGMLSDRIRVRRVHEFLQMFFGDYEGNTDYGKVNGRYHVHAVCGCHKRLKYKNLQKAWSYGNLDIKPFKITDDLSVYHGSSYLLKLSNHGGKYTTGTAIRPRKKKSLEQATYSAYLGLGGEFVEIENDDFL